MTRKTGNTLFAVLYIVSVIVTLVTLGVVMVKA